MRLRSSGPSWRRLLAQVTVVGTALSGCSTQQVTVPLMPPLIPTPKPSVLWAESFDALDPHRWRNVEVHGFTHYAAVVLEGRACLKAHSQAVASILLTPVQFDPNVYEWLSWDWRVDKLVDGEALQRKDGSDAAARLYVYFETRALPWQKRNLDYVWSASLPVGTALESAYAPSSKILVVDSGPAFLGQWRHVERNIKEDYRRRFGKNPPRVIAIGMMTDTDNTATEALAYFDDVRVSRKSLVKP